VRLWGGGGGGGGGWSSAFGRKRYSMAVFSYLGRHVVGYLSGTSNSPRSTQAFRWMSCRCHERSGKSLSIRLITNDLLR